MLPDAPPPIPYAYTLQHLDRWEPPCWPTLGAAVAYLIERSYGPDACRRDNPLRAHYADPSLKPTEPNLTPFMEQIPTDEAALRVELQAMVDADRAAFDRTYPNGREPGTRCSGDYRLCEMGPEELDALLRREMERRSWQWRGAV